MRVAVEMTHDYINLALEHLSGGDLAIAIEHLRDTHLQLLFRLGISLTIDLRKRAGIDSRTIWLRGWDRTSEILRTGHTLSGSSRWNLATPAALF